MKPILFSTLNLLLLTHFQIMLCGFTPAGTATACMKLPSYPIIDDYLPELIKEKEMLEVEILETQQAHLTCEHIKKIERLLVGAINKGPDNEELKEIVQIVTLLTIQAIKIVDLNDCDESYFAQIIILKHNQDYKNKEIKTQMCTNAICNQLITQLQTKLITIEVETLVGDSLGWETRFEVWGEYIIKQLYLEKFIINYKQLRDNILPPKDIHDTLQEIFINCMNFLMDLSIIQIDHKFKKFIQSKQPQKAFAKLCTEELIYLYTEYLFKTNLYCEFKGEGQTKDTILMPRIPEKEQTLHPTPNVGVIFFEKLKKQINLLK